MSTSSRGSATCDCARLLPNSSVRCARRWQETALAKQQSGRRSSSAEHPRARRRVATHRLQPGAGVRKPSQRRTRVVRPLPPQTIETMRAHLLDRDRRLDATLVPCSPTPACVQAKPSACAGTTSASARSSSSARSRSASSSPPKPARARTVRLLAPLAETSRRGGRRPARALRPTSSSPSPDGSPWNATAPSTGANAPSPTQPTQPALAHARPYDLRHSFISLLIAQGATVVEVARQAGQPDDGARHLRASLRRASRSADAPPQKTVIRAARAAAIHSRKCPFCVRAQSATTRPRITKSLQIRDGPIQDSNLGPLPYQRSALTD